MRSAPGNTSPSDATRAGIDMLARLVSFPTVSRDSNLPLIEMVEGYLADLGIGSTRVPDQTGTKAALFAQIGPDVPGGVILSGHTDVVPIDGQDWDTDPWQLVERDGRLYGRGTCDMKGFIALALAAVPRMQAADLKRPVQLALSYDEEVGCIGAPPLIDAMCAALPAASAAIIGEPTNMSVVTGHKSVSGLTTRIRGHEVHSSLMHTGVSAVMSAAELIGWLSAQTDANRRKSRADSPYVPPWTTLHVGKIEGGTAHNITARDCWFSTDIRSLPDESADAWLDAYRAQAAALQDRLREVHPDAAVEIHVSSQVPGCAPEPGGVAEALCRRLTGDNGQHVVAYGTEAGQFQERGYSAAICGPGSIAQAHQANEFIELSEMAAGTGFMDRLIADLSATG